MASSVGPIPTQDMCYKKIHLRKIHPRKIVGAGDGAQQGPPGLATHSAGNILWAGREGVDSVETGASI